VALKRSKKGGINQATLLFSGILFLGASILIYYLILQGVYGKFGPSEFIPKADILESFLLGGKADVAILYSKHTEHTLPEGSTWLSDNITTWKKFLRNDKFSYDVITDEAIESGKHFKYKVLIMPGSRSLSDDEIVQVKKFIDNGGSVFATSGTASYSDNGKWRGWEFISEVFGLKFSKEMGNDNAPKIHTLRGGLPLTANIPTGYPLKIATWDKPMAVEVLEPRITQASFWYNYRVDNGLAREELKKSAGIIYGKYGKGRFVWMGFEINSVIGEQEDYIYFDRFFSNCLNWLSYNPIAYIKDWPDGYEAAAVIMPTLSQDVNNVKNIFGVLASEKVNASFFVDPSTAEQNASLVKSLTNYGDVSAIVDIGYLASVNDTVNKLNSFNMQMEKLKSAKSVIERITKKPVPGAYPYYGLFDQNTLKALTDAQYNFVITDSLTDRSVPRTVILGKKRIVSMTKTSRDDYEVIRDFGLTQPDFQFYTYQEDIDRVLFEGGLYLLKLHTDYQLRPEYTNVIKDVVKDLKKKKVWIATASEINSWYSKKNYIEIKVNRLGEKRVSVTISNPGNETINGIILDVNLNDDAKNIHISGELIGTVPAKYQFNKETKMVYMYVDNLHDGESRTYYLDYEKDAPL
jgi:peptidoglycan/xylan/chitin deacetylase (PgdA/CDA1 family)